MGEKYINQHLFKLYMAQTEGAVLGAVIDLIKEMGGTNHCKDCDLFWESVSECDVKFHGISKMIKYRLRLIKWLEKK